jgi:hypothetical protein
MPKAKQTYIGGIDQDTSKLKYKQTSYFEAHNFKVVTEDGSSTGALENERGNKLTFKIPSTSRSYKLRRTDVDAVAGSETIDVLGTPISYTASDNILTNADLFAFLNANATIQALITANTLKLIEDDNFVYFIGLNSPLTVTVVGTDCTLTTVAEAQSNLKICGMGYLDQWIVVFTTSETAENPTSSTGDQIWKLKYNEYSNAVEGVVGGLLVPSTHLIYNNQLRLSTHHRIEEPITRYETDKIGRVYFTDNYNPLRSINIFDDNLWILPPGNLDIVSDVSLSKPVIQSLGVGTGSIPAGSTVQYAYRLINQTQGNTTIFSPASTLVTLTKNDSPSTTHHGAGGGTAFIGADSINNASGGPVTYTIEGIDTDYDVIEHYYILWSTRDNPVVYKFKEEFVPSNGTLTVIHDGSEDDLPITTVEYNALTNPLVAKTLTSKDDRLVAANIKEPIFDIDFDARAYRSKVAGGTSFDIYNSDGTSNSYNTGNWDTIPEEHDAINPYNQQDPDVNADWATADQYKYAPGQSYLGGEGPNVSYKFVTQGYSGNDLYANPTPVYRPFTKVDRYLASDSPLLLGDKNLDGSNVEYPRGGEIKNMASAKINGVLRGYARGEVYRFGITFYDLKGNPSFVKWIGDIKFPEIFDTTDDATSGITNTYKLINFNSGVSNLFSLGIEFSVDISSIADKISGFSIVRVQREEEDKTRLGTGLVMHFNHEDNGNSLTSVFHAQYGQDVKSTNIDIDGSGEPCITLMDRPGFTDWHSAGSSGSDDSHSRSLATFCSPLGPFRLAANYKFRRRDYIQTTGYYNGYAEVFYNDVGNESMGAWYKMREYAPATLIDNTTYPTNNPDGYQKFLIDAEIQMTAAQSIGTTNPAFDNAGGRVNGQNFLINASYSRKSGGGGGGPDVPLGMGNTKQLLVLNTDGSSTGLNPDNWWDAAQYPTGSVSGMFYDTAGASLPIDGKQEFLNLTGGTTAGRSDNFLKFKEASYNRFLLKQYGGDAYIDRSKSVYISTGHFQATAEVSSLGSNFTFKVFGGDMFVTYYDEEYITQYWSQVNPYDGPANSKLAVGLMYPCESSINTELRFGKHFSTDRDNVTPNMGAYQFEDYKILYAYNQENNVKTQFFAKDALVNLSEEQRFTIKVSNAKVDGELIDNWKIFLPLNELPVEGIHGQINKIVNLRSNVFFYQDSAVGVAAINDRVTQVSESGVEIVLGTGEVISDYSYMTTETGSIHQHSVVTSGGSIYHYDDRLKKMFRLSEGMQPISDIKGLSAFFGKIDGSLEENDVTLKNLGVHGMYDRRHNRVLMTFLNYKIYDSTIANKTYEVGDIIFFGGIYYRVTTAFTAPDPPLVPSTDPNLQPIVDKFGNNTFLNGFTLSYNEMMNAFESFHDYKPNIYLHTGRRLLSVNSFTNDGEVFEHDVDDYGKFYNDYYNSKITLILAPGADIIKVFDNIEYNAEISIDDIDAPNEALKQMRFYNDYQDTGIIPLTLGTNVIRRMRKYRSTIPRDATDPAASPKPRMRDSYIFLELEFENNADNRRLVLHDIEVSFRPANM